MRPIFSLAAVTTGGVGALSVAIWLPEVVFDFTFPVVERFEKVTKAVGQRLCQHGLVDGPETSAKMSPELAVQFIGHASPGRPSAKSGSECACAPLMSPMPKWRQAATGSEVACRRTECHSPLPRGAPISSAFGAVYDPDNGAEAGRPALPGAR
jgi:hypothetical protein